MRAVVVLSRHGARTPATNVMEGSESAIAEMMKWGNVVPAATHDFDGWHQRFPVQPPIGGTEVEPHEWPWAQLSWVGISQVKTLGQELVRPTAGIGVPCVSSQPLVQLVQRCCGV